MTACLLRITSTVSSIRRKDAAGCLLAFVACGALVAGRQTSAQLICPVTEVTSGLSLPLGIAQSALGSLIVAETGTSVPNSGRLSIVEPDGSRRTLLDGLPSGINDVNEPSGPAGLFMRGRTLYVAIGVGDIGRPGPFMGTTVANPNPSSPIFSSVLAIHFSANVERTTSGFAMSLADQQTLATGTAVRLSNGQGDILTMQLVADFPNFTPNPLPFFAGNIRLSNPFDLVVDADRLYVTDGGQNLTWAVDLPTGQATVLASFPPVSNPVAPFGPPFLDAVPTGIAISGRNLLVALFRGFPFPPGTSVVERIEPATGAHAALITGLKTAIDVVPINDRADTDYLLLQHVSGAPGPPALGGPGVLWRVETAGQAPSTIANCLGRPTSMVLDERTGAVYVAELVGGRVVAIPFGSR
jgi:hypothetical protein